MNPMEGAVEKVQNRRRHKRGTERKEDAEGEVKELQKNTKSKSK